MYQGVERKAKCLEKTKQKYIIANVISVNKKNTHDTDWSSISRANNFP